MGLQAVLSSGSGVFQYYVKVVPTSYAFASGKELQTCQYSVTDQFKSALRHILYTFRFTSQ